MTENKNIPEHWQVKRLEDLLSYVIGGDWGKDATFPDESYDFAYCIRGSEIRNWEENKGNTASLRKVKKSNIIKRQVKVGDILVEISGGGPEQPVGRTVLIDQSVLLYKPEISKICTNFLRLLRPDDSIDSRFLDLFLKFFYLSGEIVKYQAGSNNLRNLKFQDYLRIYIPIPPLPEQRAIVSKIEELFNELDNGKQQLLTAKQQLKVYRQSLLKAAFEGKLTAAWRKAQKLKREENLAMAAEPEISYHKSGELPEGWKFVDLNYVCSIKRGKSKHRPRNDSSLFGGKYPFIQTGDIRNANGGYISTFSQTYNEKGLLQSYLWPAGTLCITIAANIGETAILKFEACFPDSVVGLVCDEKKILNKFCNYFFISYKSKLEELAPATAQKNINVDILEKVRIPLPIVEEQKFIVELLESKLTVCDKMEETIAQSLQQAETLKQSILKRAFEGKLV